MLKIDGFLTAEVFTVQNLEVWSINAMPLTKLTKSLCSQTTLVNEIPFDIFIISWSAWLWLQQQATSIVSLSVQYRVENAEKLDAYLKNHQPTISKQGIEEFGVTVVGRRVLQSHTKQIRQSTEFGYVFWGNHVLPNTVNLMICFINPIDLCNTLQSLQRTFFFFF